MDSISDEEIPQTGISDILDLILPSEGKPYSKLWHSWHFLQVYSVWGLRLPATEIELKSVLSITDPGNYPFFPLMLMGNEGIKKNSQFFQVSIFPQVISLARNLLDYSKNVTPVGENFFSMIIDFMKNDNFKEALEIIQELKNNSSRSYEESVKIHENLNIFFSELQKSSGTLEICQKEIEKQDLVSSATLEVALGDENTEGSLSNLQKNVNELFKQYNEAKVIAITSVSYAWVFPFGLIAAAVVAGVYGSRATNLLNQYNDAKARFDEANRNMTIAFNTQNSLKLSNEQLALILEATKKAIEHTDVVRNAWNGILGSLDLLSKKVSSMVTETDKGQVLKSIVVVKSYCDQSILIWTSMILPLTDLVTDPYIHVEDGDQSLIEFNEEVEKEIDKITRINLA